VEWYYQPATNSVETMQAPSQTTGKLIRRYKRFLADVQLDDGEIITVHCPNTGSMKNCIEEGASVWLSRSDKPSRKYPFTWELTRTARGHFIGINTGKANAIVKAGILGNKVAEVRDYPIIKTEQKYGSENSRIDILLSGHSKYPDCFLEVKSVTLLEAPVSKGLGYFPDSVSERGSKHLRELMQMVEQGYRAVLFYCVQHSGIHEVRPASHIDHVYADTLRRAVAAGVEVLAYKVSFRGNWPVLGKPVPFTLEESISND
jgi:sugar fermentation stimulation protein A